MVPALPIEKHRQIECRGIEVLSGVGVGITCATAHRRRAFPGQRVEGLLPAAFLDGQRVPRRPVEGLNRFRFCKRRREAKPTGR